MYSFWSVILWITFTVFHWFRSRPVVINTGNKVGTPVKVRLTPGSHYQRFPWNWSGAQLENQCFKFPDVLVKVQNHCLPICRFQFVTCIHVYNVMVFISFHLYSFILLLQVLSICSINGPGTMLITGYMLAKRTCLGSP